MAVPVLRNVVAGGLALCIWTSAASADECPTVRRGETSVTLHVPAATRRALEAVAPGFRIRTSADYSEAVQTGYASSSRQCPWAVVGDFDGDGWCDLIVDGRDKLRAYRFCVWGGPQGPRVVTLSTRAIATVPKVFDSVLEFVAPGEPVGKVGDKPTVVFADAFRVREFGRGSRLYYFKGGRFREFSEEH